MPAQDALAACHPHGESQEAPGEDEDEKLHFDKRRVLRALKGVEELKPARRESIRESRQGSRCDREPPPEQPAADGLNFS